MSNKIQKQTKGKTESAKKGTSSNILDNIVTLNGRVFRQCINIRDEKANIVFWHCKETNEKITHNAFFRKIESSINENNSSVVSIDSDADASDADSDTDPTA
jgi:hypothetical protein